ncbi:hypothetical protein [Novosphingobium gossypii]|uniref:hypothetical protein n=1 Tax=Novosphingobium gossypii TaxID=1604774 RepID=UPI003D23E744
MQQTTAFAIRGIIKVLRDEGILDQRQTALIIDELAAADAEAERRRQASPNERYHLRLLAIDVAKEAGINPPFEHAVSHT